MFVDHDNIVESTGFEADNQILADQPCAAGEDDFFGSHCCSLLGF